MRRTVTMKWSIHLCVVAAFCTSSEAFAKEDAGVMHHSISENRIVSEELPVPNSIEDLVPLRVLQAIADVQLQGIVRPKREAVLRFPVGGIVQELHVREGDTVVPGQPLIRLDDRVAQSEVESARVAMNAVGNLIQARLQVKRANEILERTRRASINGASAMFEVESKEMDVKLAEAAVKQQEEAIEQFRAQWRSATARCQQFSLEAPIAGEVVLINARIGNTIDPNMIAIQLADLALLETELHLPSELFGAIHVGQSFMLAAGKPVNRLVEAKVVYVSQIIEPTSNTFLARMEIDNQSKTMPSGFEVWVHRKK